MGLRATPTQLQQFCTYLELLRKWNRSINLTAVAAPSAAVSKHILDSIAALPNVSGGTLLDIGSGAGLPGIPLAIMRPDLRVSLLDSRGRKVQFLLQAISQLGLDRVQALQVRVERYRPNGKFDTLVARAFGRIPDVIAMSGHLCPPGGRILAWKGVAPAAELRGLPPEFAVTSVQRLDVPGLDAERHLVVLERRQNLQGGR